MNAENTPLTPLYRELHPTTGTDGTDSTDSADGADGTDGIDGVRALLADVEAADGVAPYSEAFLRSLDGDVDSGADGYRHLTAQLDGRVVGVLSVNPSYVAEMAVLPDARRQGVASGLLREMGRRLDTERPLSVWSHGDLDAAQGFAGDRRARTVRELLKMSVDCTDAERRAALLAGRDEATATVRGEGLDVMDYPSACEAFGADHVDAEWVRVNNEAFAWHPEQGGWDLARLTAARDVDWFDPSGVILLFDGSDCLGFHWTKRPAGDPHGEVYVVCLADAARGRGLGGPVTLLGIGHLLDGGAEAVDLYVEGDNAPAVATYRRLGFEVVHRDVVYRGMI